MSDEDPKNESNTMKTRSGNKTLPSKKSFSIGRSVTGPIKSRLTQLATNGEVLLKRAMEYFTKVAEGSDQPSESELEAVDKLHSDLQKIEAKAASIHTVIEQKLNLPEMKDHPEISNTRREIHDELEKFDLPRFREKIRRMKDMIATELKSRKYTISPPNQEVDTSDNDLSDEEEGGNEVDNETLVDSELPTTRPPSVVANSEYQSPALSESDLNTSSTQNSARQKEIEKKEAELAKKEEELKAREDALKQRATQAEALKTSLAEKEQQLEEMTKQKEREEAKARAAKNIASMGNEVTRLAAYRTSNANIPETRRGEVVENTTNDTGNQEVKPIIPVSETRFQQSDSLQFSKINEEMNEIRSAISEMHQSNKKFQKNVMEAIEHKKESEVHHFEDEYYHESQRVDNAHQSNIPNQKVQPQNQEIVQQQLDLNAIHHLIPKFNGTGDFGAFCEDFKVHILENKRIPDPTKFLILQQHVVFPASEYIQRTDDKMEAVQLTLNQLEQVYGTGDSRMEIHKKLLNLSFSQRNCQLMTQDLAKHDILVTKLKAKGMILDDERTIQPICKKLPPAIKDALVPLLNKGIENVTWNQLHTGIKNAINSLKTRSLIEDDEQLANDLSDQRNFINYTNDHQSSTRDNQGRFQKTGRYQNDNYMQQNQREFKPRLAFNPADHPKSYKDPRTGEILDGIYQPAMSGPFLHLMPYTFPFNKPEVGETCNACSGPHKTLRCPLKSSEFRKAIYEKKLCKLCTSNQHKLEQCISKRNCVYCQGLHNSGGCPQKEHFRDEKNYPRFAKSIVRVQPPPRRNQFFRTYGHSNSQ